MSQHQPFGSLSEIPFIQPQNPPGTGVFAQPASQGAWSCPLCQLRSSQFDEISFLRHLDQLHAVEVNAKKVAGPNELSEWRRNLTQRAFAAGNHQTQDDRSYVRPAFQTQPVKTNSWDEFKRLSIGSHAITGNEATSGLGVASVALNQATVVDEASKTTAASRQSTSSPASRLQAMHLHSPVKANQNSRAGPRVVDSDFRKHTSQTRGASREVLDSADEASTDVRRKRQSGTSQPSTPPSLSSPRPQIPLSRNKGVLQGHPDPRYPTLILEPDSRGISQEQLATEVKTIYNALTTLESKCIKVDKEQALASEKGRIAPNTWRVLIGIHRHLLNDHHDFFLASQHPSASAPLHRLALKYNMPARMWKHGIHSFLELLRHQLPYSLEFMVSFIYLAYQMMSLLLETVPSFEETWIECLGDLSRYRMAVEEDDPRDRETWSNVARYWYSKAADRMPNTGRLYHHLAILARPNALQQNFLYTRSLISAQLFLSARESIQTLYDPIIREGSSFVPEVDASFIKTAAFLFYRRYDEIEQPMNQFLGLLDNQIGRVTSRWREYGTYVAGVTIGALLDFGNKNKMQRIFELGNYMAKELDISKDSARLTALRTPLEEDADSDLSFSHAEKFFFSTLAIVFQRPADRNTHAYAHVVLSFFLSLVSFYRLQTTLPELQELSRGFLTRVPWDAVCRLLNTLSKTEQFGDRYEVFDFLRPEHGDPGPLPEDFLLRGMVFTQTYFPSDWFDGAHLDDDRTLEYQSTIHRRGERLMWIGYKLSQYGCLTYDTTNKTWTTNTESPCVTQMDSATKEKNNDAEKSNRDYHTSSEFVNVDSHTAKDQQMTDVDQLTLINLPEIHQQIHQQLGLTSDKIQKDSTTLVLDANVLLNHTEVFTYLVSSSWTVAVSTHVLNKLRRLSKLPQSPEAAHANAAILRIENELKQNNPVVKVLDIQGHDINFQTVLSEEPSDSIKDDDGWELVELTRRASDLNKKSITKHQQPSATGFADSMALVSDDESVIDQAKKVNLYVITSSQVIKTASMDTQATSNVTTAL